MTKHFFWKFQFFFLVTACNTTISPNFLVWKFYGKAEFQSNCPKLSRSFVFPQNFYLGNQAKFLHSTRWVLSSLLFLSVFNQVFWFMSHILNSECQLYCSGRNCILQLSYHECPLLRKLGISFVFWQIGYLAKFNWSCYVWKKASEICCLIWQEIWGISHWKAKNEVGTGNVD